MKENSAVEHHYYYPLAASAAKAASNLNDDEKEGTCAEEGSVHRPSISQGNPGINKYALGGAILASTNSILLGYGEFHKIMLNESNAYM